MDTTVESLESTQSLTSLLEEVCQQNNHDGSLNSVSDDGDSIEMLTHNQNGDLNSSEDGDSSLCFETTIIEMEELIGDEEEFQKFIELMAQSENPQVVNSSTSPILDINCNEIKDKTVIPVIDLLSDDEEESSENVSLGLGLSNTIFESLDSPVRTTEYSNQDSPIVSSPIAASVIQPTKSDLISLGVKDVMASFLNYTPSVPSSDVSTNPVVLNTDGLLSLNNKSGTVGKPLLPESKIETKNEDAKKFSSKLIEDDFKESLLDENCNTVGYLDFTCINSPSPKTEELLLSGTVSSDTHGETLDPVIIQTTLSYFNEPKETFNCDMIKETLDSFNQTDTNEPKSTVNFEVIEESFDSVIQTSRDSNVPKETVNCEVIEESFDSVIQTSRDSNVPKETVNCEVIEETLDSVNHTLPCNSNEPIEPVNDEVSEENDKKTLSLSFYDQLDIEPCEVNPSAEYDPPIILPSPPPPTVAEEFVDDDDESSLLLSPVADYKSVNEREVIDILLSSIQSETPSTSQVQEKLNSCSQFEPPFLSDSTVKEVDGVPKPADVEDCVSSIAGNSNSNPSRTSSSPELHSWQLPWVSTDEAENADNNDPEWDLLKKLENDKERYRVVREQWRQLEIPDPRRDLTCHNYRRNRSQCSSGTKSKNHLNVRQSRKRTRSLDVNDEENPSKRRRMVSCTMMFESRINDINAQINQQFMNLKAGHAEELKELSIQQQLEHQRFFYSSAPGHIVQRQMNDILYQQDMQIQDLNSKYDRKLQTISREKKDAIYLLRQASKEVLAFNKFYNDLGSSPDDYCDITEEELQQFHETENMYEEYSNIYTG